MSSGPTKTHGYDLPSDDGSCIDDTDPRKPPPHWTFEGGKYPSFVPLHWVLWALFQFLCLVSFGQKNLRHVWAACYRGCSKEVWEKKRGAMRERVQHINIVAGLLLTAMMACCTTDPPSDGRFLPYTNAIPYFFILIAVISGFLSVMVGSSIVFILYETEAEWFREVVMCSRFRVWVMMAILSFPTFFIVILIWGMAIGTLVAASQSEAEFFTILPYFLLFLPLVSGLVFAWIAWSGERSKAQKPSPTSYPVPEVSSIPRHGRISSLSN